MIFKATNLNSGAGNAMPFNELQRRDSWPPTIVRINDDDTDNIEDIDVDPISFFLSSPDDFDDDDEDLSAGIESSTSKTTQVREISPSKIQRRSPPPALDDDDDDDFDLAMPLSLKDFTVKYTNDGRKSRASGRTEDGLKGLGISIPEPTATRGRAKMRLAPPSKSGRGRGQTRSLSARRPRSWVAPSPDLGSITEEKESDEDGGDLGVQKLEELSVSAPVTSYIQQSIAPLVQKAKKRVHWAF